MNKAVTYSVDGDVAVVKIDHPPVNALSGAVRNGIVAALDQAGSDPAIRAVVLTGGEEELIAVTAQNLRRLAKLRPPAGPMIAALA
ncbi:enoyl-CoA hydratase-related protein [Mesorhizobium sp. BHbdii]